MLSDGSNPVRELEIDSESMEPPSLESPRL